MITIITNLSNLKMTTKPKNLKPETADSLVKSAVKLIKRRPGWILKRIALELDVDHIFLSNLIYDRGIKIKEVRSKSRQSRIDKITRRRDSN